MTDAPDTTYDVDPNLYVPSDVEPSDPPAGSIRARRVSRAMPFPTLNAKHLPVDWMEESAVREVLGYLQVVIGGTDKTWFRGVRTRVESFRKGEPFGHLGMTLGFPGVTPYENVGVGELSFLAPGHHAEVRLVRPNGAKKVLWTGILVSEEDEINDSDFMYTATAVGPLFQADLSIKTPSAIHGEQDLGRVIADTLNVVRSRDYQALSVIATGITTRKKGSGTPRLTGFIADLLASSVTADGQDQWTLTHDNEWQPILKLKDFDTIHITATAGQRGVRLRLSRDATQTPNVILGEGTAEDGCRWKHMKYPNIRPDDAPVFPLGGSSVFSPGSSTSGFAPFADELRDNGYSIASGNTYSSADEDEVRTAQRRAGVAVDGVVGPQTWAAIFEVGSNVGTLAGAYQSPLWIDPRVEPYLYNAQGGRIGANPLFEPERLRVERYEVFGEGVSLHEAQISARAEGRRVPNPIYVGEVTFILDPEEMSRWEIEEGMNLQLKHFRGTNRKFHISGADFDWEGGTVTCTVAERALDLMTINGIKSRNREASTDPLRRPRNYRKSRSLSDSKITWDCEAGAGIIPYHRIFGGLWTVLRIPAGQVGQIVKFHMATSSPATEFAVGIFSAPVTSSDLASMVGNPFGVKRPWDPSYDALAAAGLFAAWGGADNPAGYSPGEKGDEGATITGRLIDDGGFTYTSVNPPWVWVAEYSATSCTIGGYLRAAPED